MESEDFNFMREHYEENIDFDLVWNALEDSTGVILTQTELSDFATALFKKGLLLVQVEEYVNLQALHNKVSGMRNLQRVFFATRKEEGTRWMGKAAKDILKLSKEREGEVDKILELLEKEVDDDGE